MLTDVAALRLHPAIPWSLRAAAKDTVLPAGGGSDGRSSLLVQRGTTVLVPSYCLHRCEEYWGTNANLFYPERWNSFTPAPWTYIPFSAGPRMCPGYQFAINTASYVTVRLVQLLDSIDAKDDTPWKEELGLSMTSANGAKMSMKFRKV